MALWSWSKTASSNATADATINFAEGQAPSSVNDSARAMMARLAEWRDDISGALLTTGTSSAYVLATNEGVGTPPQDGQMLAFTPHVTNVGSGITVDGSAGTFQTAVGVLVPAGALIASTPYRAKFNLAASAWVLEGFYGNAYNIPLGGMLPYIGASAPNSNFVVPIGQAISRTTYATLFSLVGTTFGVGDGSTTFNVIDMRGNAPVGLDGGLGRFTGLTLGLQTGAVSVALSMANLPASPAPVTATTSSFTPKVGGTSAIAIPNGTSPITVTNSGTGSNQNVYVFSQYAVMDALVIAVGTNTANLGSGTAFNNTQPTIGVNYILRVI
jgi:microcystin-dependent protein